jgi:hypothetical protein
VSASVSEKYERKRDGALVTSFRERTGDFNIGMPVYIQDWRFLYVAADVNEKALCIGQVV